MSATFIDLLTSKTNTIGTHSFFEKLSQYDLIQNKENSNIIKETNKNMYFI